MDDCSNKTWELVDEFDDLNLRKDVSVDSEHNRDTSTNHDQKLPGMTFEYLQFCHNLPDAAIPIEDLQKKVYGPLKEKNPYKFQGNMQDVEFYTELIVNGKKYYRKLTGKVRDIAVQNDIYEQIKRRKAIESSIEGIHSKLKSIRLELAPIRTTNDPAIVCVFEGLLKNIETAIVRGVPCEMTLHQLSRFVDISWILFFEKDVVKKRKNIARAGCAVDHTNKLTDEQGYTTDQSAKRMKGNPTSPYHHSCKWESKDQLICDAQRYASENNDVEDSDDSANESSA